MSQQSYEFSAKTVDAAIQEGLRQLGTTRDRVEVEVLHEGSRGLLGIGSTDARIRMMVLPEPEPEPGPEPEPVQATAPEAKEREAAAEEEIAEDGDADSAEMEAALHEMDEGEAGEEEAEEPTTLDETGEMDFAGDEEEPEEEPEEELVEEADLEPLGKGLLEDLLAHMDIDAHVASRWEEADSEDADSALILNIEGDDLGILIGRHGETLSSIQYLVRLMVNQRLHRWTNIVVDVDDYKQRRAERLAQMAQRMAEQVVRTGRSVALEPMPPHERRLVHLALRDHDEVYTESTGEGSRRKVQILLK